MPTRLLRVVSLLLIVAPTMLAQVAAPYEVPPIDYGKGPTRDPVARLVDSLGAKDRALAHDESTGYLRALLAALDIPVTSQVLVFSKTSFQNSRISPQNPRAVYFGDEAYVGFVPGGAVLEISAMDPEKGPIFYTLEQTKTSKPVIARRTTECLTCHASARTQYWPAHLVRSVYPTRQGHPRTSEGSFLTTHESPFRQRWGGWYVTGRHGAMRHLGNLTLDEAETALTVDRDRGANVTDLTPHIDTARYLTKGSDIVALMVLEHQTHMHNVLARAGYVVRRALYLQRAANRALGDPEDRMTAVTKRVIHRAADEVVEALMFKNEARLKEPVEGTSTFAATFATRGPRDEAGRSLRALDLKERLFRYPCSYLIYSPSFDALPKPLLARVYDRLGRVLSGHASRRAWGITRAQRTAILEILLATKNGVPASWNEIRRRR